MRDPCACEERGRRIEELEARVEQLQALLHSPKVRKYLHLLAEYLLEDSATDEDLYALWSTMNCAEQDLAQPLVKDVFGDWIET